MKASGRRTVSRKRPTAAVSSSSARKATRSAASRDASPPEETTQRNPTRPGSARHASATEPDCATTPTRPRTNVSGTIPIHGDGPSGTAIPMQFGPTIAASTSAARAVMRAAAGGPSGPASFPRPGTTNARTPAATASSNACPTVAWPTSRSASSGCSGRSAKLGTQARPFTSRFVG